MGQNFMYITFLILMILPFFVCIVVALVHYITLIIVCALPTGLPVHTFQGQNEENLTLVTGVSL